MAPPSNGWQVSPLPVAADTPPLATAAPSVHPAAELAVHTATTQSSAAPLCPVTPTVALSTAAASAPVEPPSKEDSINLQPHDMLEVDKSTFAEEERAAQTLPQLDETVEQALSSSPMLVEEDANASPMRHGRQLGKPLV